MFLIGLKNIWLVCSAELSSVVGSGSAKTSIQLIPGPSGSGLGSFQLYRKVGEAPQSSLGKVTKMIFLLSHPFLGRTVKNPSTNIRK